VRFDQQRRYARQIMLPEMGEQGQEKLLAAKVLVIGAGGLGSSLVSYLAAAGVGHLGIVDHDRVELSNLGRQILHETGDIGRLKVESAADRVDELNPDVTVTTYPFAITAENARALVSDYDVVADGCDNFASRFLINKTCVALGIPLVSAAIAGFEGQLMTIHHSACYQCFVSPDAPDANTCRESGVIGPLAGIIGSMQALEVIRVLLGIPALVGKIAHYNGLGATSRISNLVPDPSCPICR
jgi:molybdopterin/thiamine biosynthesis adenylyltransferase